ncbi:ribonuclease HI [Poseidonibacter sp.]|uniref:ribonuclease HI n=1 Tax=Poseidonibacter sp. TaxID=2321188 RepID=UPI003C72B800
MSIISLFTDGSVNPQLNIGFGAYLILSQDLIYSDDLQSNIQLKKFEDTSSTKLELQTLLWAINSNDFIGKKVIVYTDCQNILGLLNRRERFIKNNYYSKSGKLIANHELYKEFYKLIDSLDFEFIKVKGHKTSSKKDDIDKIFTLVDKGSRTYLRDYINKLQDN